MDVSFSFVVIVTWISVSEGGNHGELQILQDAIQEANFQLHNNETSQFVEHRRRRTSAKCTSLTEKIGKESTLNLRAYQILLQKKLSQDKILEFLYERLPPICKREIENCAASKYRTVDGTCNNLQNPFWGASFTPFKRLLPAVYEDGYNEQRGGENSVLPNVRRISSVIHYDQIIADTVLTNMVGQFGQFLDHDITLTPEGDKRCCTTERSAIDCWPIEIPSDDNFYSERNQTCLEFTRSTPFCFPSMRHNVTLERKQMNVLTAFIDASNVYGSDEITARNLRLHENGLLRFNLKNPNLLPTVEQVRNATGENIEYMGTFYAGDERVNEMPALATLHTRKISLILVFVREHNRVAVNVKKLFEEWTDEKIYEETRRIVIAQMQNIVYGEYLPVILGDDTMKKYKLTLGRSEGQYYSTYNPSIDPTVVHSFSTAAYRFGHTLINGIVQLVKNMQKIGEYQLRHNFLKSEQIFGPLGDGEGYNYILEGLATQPAQKYDNFVTEDLGRFLLREDKNDFGQDLIARNLQRGRDHGIPAYNDFRIFCGFPPLPTEFHQLPTWPHFTNGTWQQFEQLYKSPSDIDLFTGGLTEQRNPGALTGPTFNCIKAIQFERAKFGDRYFFTHVDENGSFTESQLAHLRSRKFSDLICENSNLREISMDVFKIIPEVQTDSTNRFMFCDPTKSAQRVLLDLELLLN